MRDAAALVRRVFAIVEGREAETAALAAQWKAEGRAALEMFAQANPSGFVKLVLRLCRDDFDDM